MSELSYTTNMTRKIVVFMLAVLLPGVFCTSAYGAALIFMAQAPTPAPIPGMEQVAYLADKNIAYWLVALALFAIGSWTYAVKWLIQQLESQRTANAESTNKLVSFVSTDHANSMVIMTRVTDVLERVVEKLDGKK
jgi:hypothetical protein